MKEVSKEWTVTEAVFRAKTLLESDPHLNDIMVVGEVSNFSCSATGHWYFNLKDDDSVLQVAMFKNANIRVNFKAEDGKKIRVQGKITVYPQRGQMQLIAHSMQIAGEGEILERLKLLAEKLEKEGIFDVKKGPLPTFPESVAIVTSSQGAALRDIIKVLRKRAPYVDILIAPCTVQGKDAPLSIIRALGLAEKSRADLVIVGRGGGSLEDLIAFSDEEVVRTIAGMEKPVISAVGHQTDTMLSDFAADHRAATPSEAGENAVQEVWTYAQQVDRLEEDLKNILIGNIDRHERHLEQMEKAVGVDMLRRRVANLMDNLKGQKNLLDKTYMLGLKECSSELGSLGQGLEKMNPRRVFKRGYSITESQEGEIIRSVASLKVGADITTHVKDGSIRSTVKEKEEKEWKKK